MNRIIYLMITGIILLCFCSPVFADDPVDFPDDSSGFDEGFGEDFPAEGGFDMNPEHGELGFEDQSGMILEMETNEAEKEDSVWGSLMAASRFTVRHELSYKTEEPEGVVNNRSSVRLEFSRFFGTYYFLQFDTKFNLFWGNDHRAEAEKKETLVEPSTKEAFLQASFGNTSLKAGIQIMIWGESDGGAITDVISPRDYSELFFISLEESRIGQPMLVLDQFTEVGDWTLFYIPDPKFNAYPEPGTAYYYDAFSGQAEFRDSTSDDPVFEYGLRWKKTFGKSDLALMVASLIENDYAYRFDGYTSSGKWLVTKTKQRFTMAGMTFNYASGNFLYKGEFGRKSPQSYNDASYRIVKKDVSDVALGLEYSPGSSYTIGLEAVNSHVHDWEEGLQNTPQDTRSLVISWSDTFLNEDLSVNWLTSYSEPYVALFHSLRTSLKWDDHITFEFEAFYPDIRDKKNSSWIYRDQKQVAIKAQVQF